MILNRNVPFAEDVLLLQKLVGDSDPELQAALTKLAPQAEKGGVETSVWVVRGAKRPNRRYCFRVLERRR